MAFTVVEKVIFLQNVDVFASVPTEQLAYIAAIAEEVSFLQGDVIYQLGDATDSLYVVVDGKVRLHRDSEEIMAAGAHEAFGTWALLDDEPRLLRPANYPSGNPGSGYYIVDTGDSKLAVINLQGRAFMQAIDDPFRTGRALVDVLRAETNNIVIDFHAEATAEKLAFAYYIDGLVSAVVGTHTHVPTADERILPGGTAYITDLGMTGSHAGVIGFRAETAVQRQVLGRRVRLELAEGDLRLQGAIVDINVASGHSTAIERIDIQYEEED